MPDSEQNLLQRFSANRSNRAFEGLVAYHVDMVFGCAMRRTGDTGLAEEISQNVFTILARKAHRLKAGSGLAGWLHKTTLYESAKALRGEARRNRKMKALAEHNQTQASQDETRGEILQIVDEALDELSDGDRRVVLLHYFEDRSFIEIATAIGKSPAASQKQTSRALDKLGAILKGRGVTATSATLGSILTLESAKAAPVGMVSTLSGGALANASSLTTSTLITHAIQTMTYAKTKIAILVTAAAAVPLGLQVNSIASLKEEVRRFETREAELVEREERIANLKATLAAVPLGVGGEASRENTSQRVSQLAGSQRAAKRPGETGGINTGGIGGANKGKAGEEEDVVSQPAGATANTSLAAMLDDPAMRPLLIQQMEISIALKYGDFFDYLDLDDDKRAELSAAFLDRQLALGILGMKDLEETGKIWADPSDLAEGKAVQSDHVARIKSLIGEARYDEFERYEQSITERMEIASFRDQIEERGGTLPFEKAQKLMTLMYEESTALRQNDASDPLADFENSLTPEGIASEMSLHREINERILGRVSDVLTREELEIFKENQASHLKMLKSGMESGAKVFQRAE